MTGLVGYWPTKRFLWITVGGLAGLILSKGLALVPGYALDDWWLANLGADRTLWLSQGRLVQVALTTLVEELGLDLVSVAWPATLVGFGAIALALAAGILYATRSSVPTAAASVAAFAGTAHPFMTEYFTFRMSLLTLASGFVLLLGALGLTYRLDNGLTARPVVEGGALFVLLVLLALAGQHPFVIFVLVFLARVAVEIASPQEREVCARPWNRIGFVGALILASLVTYAVIHFSAQRTVGGALDPRAALLSPGDVPQRALDVMRLLRNLLFSGEPLLPGPTKLLLMTLVALTLLGVGIRGIRMPVVLLVLGAGLIATSIGLTAVAGVWWPIPRSIFSVGLSVSLWFSVAALGLREPGQRLMTVGLGVLGLLFTFTSTAALNDQLRVNRWDMTKAQLIAHDLGSAGVTQQDPVVIVGASLIPPGRSSTTQGVMNVSALHESWVLPSLFQEATGHTWNVTATEASSSCAGVSAWPAPGSIVRKGGTTYVCLAAAGGG